MFKELITWFKPAPKEISWVDSFGIKHTLTIKEATRQLCEFWEEWPCGLEEIESALNGQEKLRELYNLCFKKFKNPNISIVLITRNEWENIFHG